MTTNFVYSRSSMKIVLKLIHMHIMRIHHFRRDSGGFSKFGVTPGGGAIAGFGWLAAWLTSIMDTFGNNTPHKALREICKLMPDYSMESRGAKTKPI